MTIVNLWGSQSEIQQWMSAAGISKEPKMNSYGDGARVELPGSTRDIVEAFQKAGAVVTMENYSRLDRSSGLTYSEEELTVRKAKLLNSRSDTDFFGERPQENSSGAKRRQLALVSTG